MRFQGDKEGLYPYDKQRSDFRRHSSRDHVNEPFLNGEVTTLLTNFRLIMVKKKIQIQPMNLFFICDLLYFEVYRVCNVKVVLG